jgi:hypothetical protein
MLTHFVLEGDPLRAQRSIWTMIRAYERLALGPERARTCVNTTGRQPRRRRNTATHLRRILEGASAAARAASNELAITFAPPKQLPRARSTG